MGRYCKHYVYYLHFKLEFIFATKKIIKSKRRMINHTAGISELRGVVFCN